MPLGLRSVKFCLLQCGGKHLCIQSPFLCKTSGAQAQSAEELSVAGERFSCSFKQCNSTGSIGLVIARDRYLPNRSIKRS